HTTQHFLNRFSKILQLVFLEAKMLKSSLLVVFVTTASSIVVSISSAPYISLYECGTQRGIGRSSLTPAKKFGVRLFESLITPPK
ncbi:hypothetical protein RYX36_004421, partial [Vicia faba]